MRRKIQPAMTLFVCILVAAGFVLPCGAEDFVAKQGVALYAQIILHVSHFPPGHRLERPEIYP